MDLEGYIHSHRRPCLEWGLLEERQGEGGVLASRKGFTQRGQCSCNISSYSYFEVTSGLVTGVL